MVENRFRLALLSQRRNEILNRDHACCSAFDTRACLRVIEKLKWQKNWQARLHGNHLSGIDLMKLKKSKFFKSRGHTHTMHTVIYLKLPVRRCVLQHTLPITVIQNPHVNRGSSVLIANHIITFECLRACVCATLTKGSTVRHTALHANCLTTIFHRHF